MNKKALALIIGGIILIALIIYFVFFFNYNKQTDTNTVGPSGPQTTAEPVIVSNTATPEIRSGTPRSAEETSRDAANQLAIYFAERFGTSSSQADFSNLTELELFMTDALKAKTNAFISAEREKAQEAPAYQSVVTQAVLVDFVTFNETSGTAEGTVKTKRQETKTDKSIANFDQNLSIALKKIDGQWKVDRADWK